MAAIGTGWADGAWVVESWEPGAWDNVPPDDEFGTGTGSFSVGGSSRQPTVTGSGGKTNIGGNRS